MISTLSGVAADTTSPERTVSLAATFVEVAQGNVKRYGIGFAARSKVDIVITTIPGSSGNVGILLPTTGVLWLLVKDHGSLPMLSWSAVAPGGAADLTVIEILLPKG